MPKFLFKKGNKYGTGRAPGTLSVLEKVDISKRMKKLWKKRKPEMIERVKIGMSTPEIKLALSQLNSRPRASMKPEHRNKISDSLAGRMPENNRAGNWANIHNGHYDINGKDFYFRSRWEANYALYLDFLIKQKEILRWEYEADTFIFHAIQFGTRSYKPDFKVFKANGGIEYHEVKGYMTPESKTKLKRMKKYYPEISIVLIGNDEYKALKKWAKMLGWY